MATILRTQLLDRSQQRVTLASVSPNLLSRSSLFFVLRKDLPPHLVGRASTRRLFRGENNGMRVEKSPPLVIHGEQPKDFFFFFSPVGRAACSKDNVSPSGRQSPLKVTSSWIVGSSMDRRSIDLVFARNDEPPPPPFIAIFLLSPHPSSLLFSLPRSLRPRFVQASQGWERFSRSNGPPMRAHIRTSPPEIFFSLLA